MKSESDSKSQSFYWSPLSQARLEESLRVDHSNIQPENVLIAEILAKRNPRNDLARATIASASLLAGDVSALESHYFPLMKISSNNFKELFKVLIALSVDDRVYKVIVNYIKTERPVWGGQYLDSLLENSLRNPNEFVELYLLYPKKNINGVYAKVLKKYGPEHAHNTFVMTSEENLNDENIVLDSEFTSAKLGWPFGWRVNKSVVEREAQGGISLVYTGRGAPTILEQISKVKPGAYTALISISGEVSRSRGYYALDIMCVDGLSLGRMNIEEASFVGTMHSLDFEIKEEDCGFIKIKLSAQAGSFPRPIRSHINSIRVLPKKQQVLQ